MGNVRPQRLLLYVLCDVDVNHAVYARPRSLGRQRVFDWLRSAENGVGASESSLAQSFSYTAHAVWSWQKYCLKSTTAFGVYRFPCITSLRWAKFNSGSRRPIDTFHQPAFRNDSIQQNCCHGHSSASCPTLLTSLSTALGKVTYLCSFALESTYNTATVAAVLWLSLLIWATSSHLSYGSCHWKYCRKDKFHPTF